MIDYRKLVTTSSEILLSELDNGVKFKPGVNNIICGDTVIKSCVINSTPSNNKLYIFLSAVGVKSRRYPLFHRISWHEFYDGMCLYFDDPVRSQYDFAPCFYFGDSSNNLLLLLKKIIYSVIRNYNIANNDVTFVSSSNGGFAAIYLCNEIQGSRSLTFNPQLDIPSFFPKDKFNRFKEITKISEASINQPEMIQRLNLYRIVDNTTSKFFIYSNYASDCDRIQIEKFFSFLKKEWQFGLNILNDNLYVYISNIDDIDDPHRIQPDMYFSKYLADVFFADSNKEQMVRFFNNILMERSIQEQKLKIINTYFSVIKSSNLDIHRKRKNVFDIVINQMFVIRVKYVKDLSPKDYMICANFRISKSYKGFDINVIRKFCIDNNLQLDESNDMVNIYLVDPINIQEFHSWIQNLSNNLMLEL